MTLRTPILLLVASSLALATACAQQSSHSAATPAPLAAAPAPTPVVPEVPQPPKPLADAAYKAAITLKSPIAAPFKQGEKINLTLAVANGGDATFPSKSADKKGVGAVFLSYHVYKAGAKIDPKNVAANATLWDGSRAILTGDLAPGRTAETTVQFQAPAKSGKYEIHFDLVHEGFLWFASKGSPELVVPIEVK